MNAHEASLTGTADYAAKDVLGTAKPREAVGEGDEEFKIAGRLFPQKFPRSGLEELSALHEMRRSQVPQIFVRGDGLNMGWWLITHVSEKHTYLDRTGVGKFIEFDLTMVRSPSPPSIGAYLSTIFRLLS